MWRKYSPPEEAPFPIATVAQALNEQIRNFGKARYMEAVETFLSGKGCCEDGYASERM